MPIEVHPEWHETYFGDTWLRMALLFPAPVAADEAAFVIGALVLEPGMRVLDVPCGHGRHSLELARRGIAVTGVDSSATSIRLAADAAKDASLDSLASFQVGDMRSFVLDEPADAAIVMQTSFGFMATDEENLGVLRNLRRSLMPGGRLLIESASLFRLIKTMIVPRRWERLADGTVLTEEREYDFLAGRMAVKMELFTPERQDSTLSYSVRIYTLPELDAMMRAAGFRLTATYGGIDGSPYGFDSKRLIVVAEADGEML